MLHIQFSADARRQITEANINYYRSPFVHPQRNMADHDFIYLLQGEWKIGQNDEIYPMTEDTLVILPAGQTHYGVSPCQPRTKTVYFHVSAADDLLSSTVGEPCCRKVQDPAIKKLFFDIVSAHQSGDVRRAEVLFALLLCQLSPPPAAVPVSELVSQVQNIIRQNPERFFSNSELASMVHVSVKTLETRFRQACAVTVHQYILRFKAEQAIAYFSSFPEMTLKDIACNLGFYDEYHFSKQFKKVTGMAPSAYRQHYKT